MSNLGRALNLMMRSHRKLLPRMLSQICANPRTRLQLLASLIILSLLLSSYHSSSYSESSSLLFRPHNNDKTIIHPPRVCPSPHDNNISPFPPLIHQNLFTSTPCNSFTTNCQARPESFGWQLSPFQYQFYSEATARSLLPLLAEKLPRHSKFTAENYIKAWDSLPLSILRADLWRYVALFMFGGIYADLDATLESPLPWQVLCDHEAWPGVMDEGGDAERGKMPETADVMGGIGGPVGSLKGKGGVLTNLIVGVEDEHVDDPKHHAFVMRQIQFLTW